MATKFTKGQTVKLIAVVPEGDVQSISMNDEGVISYLISWVDEKGQQKTRWFEEDQLTTA